MLVELVKVTTSDGVKLDGSLHNAVPGSASARFDLAICLHGVGGNFYSSSLLATLTERLVGAGISTLRVNTRGHDGLASGAPGGRLQGAAFEIVDECRLDVAAWCQWARERGYERLLLVGHSLGAIKCLYASAQEALTEVTGVIAISPPRLSYEHFVKDDSSREKFLASLTVAEQLVAEHRPDALFQAKFPFPLHITGSGYIDKYGPGERYNFLRWLERVQPPTLFTYGSEELNSAAFSGIVEQIQALSREAVTIIGADHFYSGQHEALAETIARWVA